jgi:hypothetical protein
VEYFVRVLVRVAVDVLLCVESICLIHGQITIRDSDVSLDVCVLLHDNTLGENTTWVEFSQ